MIQAMTTGQQGSLSTGHANSPRDMLARLETMILMAGYELPLRAIREQVTAAVDLIVHTARLRDGSRKVTHITEVYGIEDDEVLTQDIFRFEQTGVVDGKVQGELRPTGTRPTFMNTFKSSGIPLPKGEYGIPSEKDAPPLVGLGKGRWSVDGKLPGSSTKLLVGQGRAVVAGGMVYVSGVGPLDAAGEVVPGGVKEQTHRCLENLTAMLEASGSSLEKVVWANWSLKDPTDFDDFNKEWLRWVPGEQPIGQGTLMPAAQRRAGFRVSIGVIAEA